ncbi:MAG: DUF4390 domain-containing protein [Acidobacteriota bacterium]
MTRRHAPVLLAVLVAVTIPARASVGDIRVTPIIADGRVAASFIATPSFGDDAQAVVQSGLLLTMTFSVDLKRPSGFWWDHTVGSATVAASVKFDTLTGVYQVSKSQDGQVTWSERTDDLPHAREWMTRFDRVPLATGDRLEPNADYYVQVRMRASPRRTFSLWPFFGADDSVGRADFTFLR